MVSFSEEAPERQAPLARQVNARLVIETIMRDGPITRAALSRELELSKPTISDIVRRLEEAGWVAAAGVARGGVGRAGTVYVLRRRAAHVIGVDVGGSNIRAALADLGGEILGERVVSTDGSSLRAILKQITDLCRELARDSRAGWRTVRAIGVGAPGVLESSSGRIRRAFNVQVLEGVRLGGELRGILGTPVIVENDVNMAALGEHRRGHGQTRDNLCFIAVGRGIGMGLILDGQLSRGSRGAAGEIGEMPVLGEVNAATIPTLLQDVATAEAIAERYQSQLGTQRRLVVPAIFEAASGGDVDALHVIDQAARALAVAVAAVDAVVDVGLVVFGGGVGSQPNLTAPVSIWLSRFARIAPDVKLSLLGERAGVIGCVEAAHAAAHDLLFAPDHARPSAVAI